MAGFQDIIGQEQIKEHLQNALSMGKISHAYILNGEKASGKEFIAKIFAMALQSPCLLCAKMIINAGIVEVVYHQHYTIDDVSMGLLKEAGVAVRSVDEEIL